MHADIINVLSVSDIHESAAKSKVMTLSFIIWWVKITLCRVIHKNCSDLRIIHLSLCNFYRRCVVWGAQQPPVQFQRTAALERRVSPAGPSARPPEGNSPTQHTVCLRHGDIHRYLSFTLQNVGYYWFGRLVMTFRWFVHQVCGGRHQEG